MGSAPEIADEAGGGGGETVQILLFVILSIIIIYMLLTIFFNAPDPTEMMGMILNQGVKMIWGGIKQGSMSLTTLG